MLKQDVPLRTGWFGYRKLDVENCIGHLNAMYALEARHARQKQQGVEGVMAQVRQENSALRQRLAQQAAVQTVAAANAAGAREQLALLSRKLSAAHAELRRCQTKLFAYERQMIDLRRENAELEAACEQAHEEAQLALQRAEEAEQRLAAVQAAPPQTAEPDLPHDAEACAVHPEPQKPPEPEPDPVQAAQPEPPVWQPRTELERLSVELIRCFDEMMEQ